MKLKSCPFCGGNAKIKCILGRDAVICQECNAEMYSDYTPIEILVDMWNKRTIETKGSFESYIKCEVRTLRLRGNWTTKKNKIDIIKQVNHLEENYKINTEYDKSLDITTVLYMVDF